MTQTVITLRARSCSTPPRPGELMAAETGTAVYRIDAVTTLLQAGERPGAHRYRLTCTLLAPSEVPSDAAIHPWRWGWPRAASDGATGRSGSLIGTPAPAGSRNRPARRT